MNDTDHNGLADESLNLCPDFHTMIASLRKAGAEQLDPVSLYYIETLAKRAMACQENIKQILYAKLNQALAAFKARFERAQSDARQIISQTILNYPHAEPTLQRLFAAGNFKEMQRFIASLKTVEQRLSLGMLVRQLDEHSPADMNLGLGNATLRPELKTLQHFRNTWSKLSVDKQLIQALEQAPKNAGPINSHMLVLRSLALMRDISPDYLNRFISYADTLLCLDQCEKEKSGNTKKSQTTKMGKK